MTPHRRPAPTWYVLVAVMVSMLATAGAGIWYTHHVQRDAERKWCGIVSTLDDAYRAAPPQSTAGRRLAVEMAELRRQFHCP